MFISKEAFLWLMNIITTTVAAVNTITMKNITMKSTIMTNRSPERSSVSI